MDSRFIIQAIRWFIVLAMLVGISNGQSVSLTGPTGVQQGDEAVFTCTASDITSPTMAWYDGPTTVIYFGDVPFSNDEKYNNFYVSADGLSSTMTITDAAFEDDGSYSCNALGHTSDRIDLTVEVKSNLTLTVNTTLLNNTYMYEAACQVIGARPEENITWTIGNITQSSGIVETDPDVSHHTLWDKRSMFTFPAGKENYNHTLTCHVSGHQVSHLNWQKSIELDFHNAPAPDNIKVAFAIEGSYLTLSCDPDGAKVQPTPAITNYYIFANNLLIHESTQGKNYVNVPIPDEMMEFTCLAGNYMGNATDAITFEPPPTEPSELQQLEQAEDLVDNITDLNDGLPLASMFSNMNGWQILSIIVVISVVMLVSIIVNIVQWFNK